MVISLKLLPHNLRKRKKRKKRLLPALMSRIQSQRRRFLSALSTHLDAAVGWSTTANFFRPPFKMIFFLAQGERNAINLFLKYVLRWEDICVLFAKGLTRKRLLPARKILSGRTFRTFLRRVYRVLHPQTLQER